MTAGSSQTIAEAPPTHFARKTAFTFVGQVVFFASNLAIGILLARLIGAEGKGAYALICSTVLLASNMASLGVPQALTFYVAREKWEPIRAFLTGTACMLAPSVAALALLRAGGAEQLFRRASFSPEIAELTWIMLMLGLPLQLIGWAAVGALRGRELIFQTVWPGMVAEVLRVSLVAFLLMLVRCEITSAVFAYLSVLAVWTVLTGTVFILAVRHWPAGYSASPSLWRLLSYGLQMQAGSIISLLLARGDLYLVNYFLGPAAVGFYSVAMSFAEFSNFPNQSITSVLFPRLVLTRGGDRLEQAMKAHRCVVLISLATALFLAATCSLIPAVYGASFSVSIIPSLICLAGCVFHGGNSVLYIFFAAENMQRLNLASRGIGLLTMIVLDLLLIPRFGIVGAATAYGFSILMTYLWSVYLGTVYGPLKIGLRLVPSVRDAREVLSALLRLRW